MRNKQKTPMSSGKHHPPQKASPKAPHPEDSSVSLMQSHMSKTAERYAPDNTHEENDPTVKIAKKTARVLSILAIGILLILLLGDFEKIFGQYF